MGYIGISSGLSPHSKGHFSSFHKGLAAGFSNVGIEITYLGLNKSEPKDGEVGFWYKERVTGELNKPLPWIKSSEFNSMIMENVDSTPKNIFIYEGNLALIFVSALHLWQHKKNTIILNIFKPASLIRRFENPFWRNPTTFILRLLLNLSGQRLQLAVDNVKSHVVLTTLSPSLEFHLFPLFSTLNSTQLIDNDSHSPKKIFGIFLRGRNATKKLDRVLASSSGMHVYMLHGVDVADFRVKYPNLDIRQSKFTDSFDDYEQNLRQINFGVFLYDARDFEYQSSGRLLDLRHLKIPVAVPEGTALAGEVRLMGGGIVFNENRPERILQSILEWSPSQSDEDFNLVPSASETSKWIIEESKQLQLHSNRERVSRFTPPAVSFIWTCYGCARILLAKGYVKPTVIIDFLKNPIYLYEKLPLYLKGIRKK